MVDPDYAYTQLESAFVPMDSEMDWNTGAARTKTGCNSALDWPLKVDAETFAWRMRDLHYTTLSMMHGYSKLDAGRHPAWLNNETIDAWMQTPLNLTRLYLDKLPVSRHYAAVNHNGYEYIRDHLGYRLELQHASWPETLTQGKQSRLSFSASIVNWGFAAPINPRPVKLVLLAKEKKRIIWRSESLADPREWQPYIPGSPFYTPMKHIIKGNLTVNGNLCGAEENCVLLLGLFLPDLRNDLFIAEGMASAYSIRFANDDVPWLILNEGGVNILGELNVHSVSTSMTSV